MWRYLGHRLIQVPLVLLVVSLMTFLITRATPGDPVQIMLGMQTSKEAADAMRAEFNLDRPLPVQYALWIVKVVSGDLGRSIRLNDPVTTMLAERLPVSLQLAAAAMIFALVVSIPLGIVAALKRNSWIDYLCTGYTVVGFAVPEFRLGPDPDLRLLDQARLVADHRHRLVGDGVGRLVGLCPSLRHPGDRAGHSADCRADAAAALQHDRRAVAGLHAHGARQGPVARHDRRGPCAQERHDSLRHHGRRAVRLHDRHPGHDRIHLRRARHGIGGVERRGQSRLSGDPGLHAGDRRSSSCSPTSWRTCSMPLLDPRIRY